LVLRGSRMIAKSKDCVWIRVVTLVSTTFLLFFIMSPTAASNSDSFVEALKKAVKETGNYTAEVKIDAGQCYVFYSNYNDTALFLDVEKVNSSEIQCYGRTLSLKRIVSDNIIDVEVDGGRTCICENKTVKIISYIRKVEYSNGTDYVRVIKVEGLKEESTPPTISTTSTLIFYTYNPSNPEDNDFILYLLTWIVLFLIVGLIYLKIQRNRRKIEKERKIDEIKAWVENELKDGEDPKLLRKSLRVQGIDPKIVDDVLRRI